jgi:hypothetical protein
MLSAGAFMAIEPFFASVGAVTVAKSSELLVLEADVGPVKLNPDPVSVIVLALVPILIAIIAPKLLDFCLLKASTRQFASDPVDEVVTWRATEPMGAALVKCLRT